MTTDQVKTLVSDLRNIVNILADADPTAKAEVYTGLGLQLEYSPRWNSLRRGPSPWGNRWCRRGDLNPHAPKGTSPSS